MLSLLVFACTAHATASLDLAPYDLGRAQTFPEVGAGQGVEVRDGMVYLYGDASWGIIREYEWVPEHELLRATGRELKLTVRGEDVIPHPTGLTFHPGETEVALIGNTVGGEGTWHLFDWGRAWAQGTLDDAILHTLTDDAAVNGSRPELVQSADGTWLVATADYGDQGNAVRLYDWTSIRKATRTSELTPVASHPSPPFVQSLAWDADDKVLILVQNQVAGLRWRLTAMDLATGEVGAPLDAFTPTDELEGFHPIPGTDHAVFFTSSPADNAWVGRVMVAGRPD